jgi:hypothetical protein
VSVACSNSGIRVSLHSSLPSRYDELAPSASWTPAIAWDAFQYGANSSGLTWMCSWVLVQAASGMIESAVVDMCSTPLIEMAMSSPRAARIWSLSSW